MLQHDLAGLVLRDDTKASSHNFLAFVSGMLQHASNTIQLATKYQPTIIADDRLPFIKRETSALAFNHKIEPLLRTCHPGLGRLPPAHLPKYR